jgi:undecaprenyl phosphate-alpha-L-ara4FN deformylase
VKLGIKIDVDTFRGTREGVPRLVDLLKKHRAGATFLFSLGPDHTGRAMRRVFRPGFFSKVSRTSVLEHYGVRTLLYGTLLPGPDIGLKCKNILRGVRDAGFEVGIHCWDHARWQDFVSSKDRNWTEREMDLACRRFEEIFGEKPRTWGAAGWQTNAHAARFQERFDYASDTRGTRPFRPVWNGKALGCAQIPTTLPTLDELVGTGDITEDNVAAHLLERTREPAPAGHVFTLHAELEGMRLAPAFAQLIAGWKAQGWTLGPTRTLFESVEPMALPRCTTGTGTIPGRTGTLLVQGPEFLADVDLAQAA